MPSFYSLQATKRQLTGSLRINDVPLVRWRDPRETTGTEGINLWIAGHQNRITVAFDWPDHADVMEPGLELLVQRSDGEGNADAVATVARFLWPPETEPLSRPATVEFRFDAEEPPPSRLWAAVRPIELDDATRAAAMTLLTALNSALTSREIDRAAALLQFKAEDVGSAMHFGAGEAVASQREFLEFFLEQLEFRMEPLDPDRVTLALVADRRLVMATRPDGSAVLRSAPDLTTRLSLPVFMAPMQGEWTIVR